MNPQTSESKPRILLLFSDTGGGHRSAAEAIVEALNEGYGDAFDIELVDIFKQYAPRPLNRMPDWYPYMVKAPRVWGASFRATDGRPQARAITATIWPVAARAARRIINSNPCDIVVTVHPLATSWILKALGKNRPPFVTVVTDMVSTHALWYDRRADLTLVPTEMARERALEYGMDPARVRVVGQPVAKRYCVPSGSKAELRAKLGWPQDKLIALLIGGGDGMGPLGETAYALSQADLDMAMVVVTGRNAKLREQLDAQHWPIPTFIYGFTRELPDFMRAADVIITKAGPGTIAEALNAGLPIILYSKLPGQEDGNVDFVVNTHTGVWAPKASQVVGTLREWFQNPARREQVAANCRQVARPDAAKLIAQAIAEKLGTPERGV